MREVLQQGCATACERLERDGFIVRRALLPTPSEEAPPFEGHGPPGSVVGRALGPLWRGRDLGPAGLAGGFRRPLPTRLAQNLGTRAPPGDPGLLPAAFRHGRHPGIFLACCGRSVARSWCPNGHQETRGKDGPGAW